MGKPKIRTRVWSGIEGGVHLNRLLSTYGPTAELPIPKQMPSLFIAAEGHLPKDGTS